MWISHSQVTKLLGRGWFNKLLHFDGSRYWVRIVEWHDLLSFGLGYYFWLIVLLGFETVYIAAFTIGNCSYINIALNYWWLYFHELERNMNYVPLFYWVIGKFKYIEKCVLIWFFCISSALFRFDRDWKKIEDFVGSKTVIQVLMPHVMMSVTYLWYKVLFLHLFVDYPRTVKMCGSNLS